ncbi:HTH CENPB-type domain-containing protein [Trichonephila inaurata madagascariensis]|uniref:HTH CENPB-type domain-containing protein n=1 Tax=Trichonephila inaurata madagascariensis TaxID=2747483 RepID=A0A8X6Y0V7_9ARAC|nr:HTH CENPB-type domain-containing protein [Trichonephila inaurata madagascariensis]
MREVGTFLISSIVKYSYIKYIVCGGWRDYAYRRSELHPSTYARGTRPYPGTSVEEEGHSRDDVYNVEKTGVYWKILPRKSLASKRESIALGFKVSKERVTAMVRTNASGTHTLPLLVIGKSKKPHCFKNVSCLPTL